MLPPLLRHRVLSRFPALTRGIQATQSTITKSPNISNASTANEVSSNAPALDSTPREEMKELVPEEEKARHMQAPNRQKTWSKSQRPREMAMVGPRFEQTILSQQPAPYAAIELIHRQKVRWSKSRVVACDGGGGPAGHPRIFINVDKPEVVPCGYCGLPFALEKHRMTLRADYPLE